MPNRIQLPRTAGCVVCGRDNSLGLRLTSFVHPDSGVIELPFFTEPRHIGFHGVVHGGILATVLDEAMVWAATWAGRRFCLAGEMTIRFRKPAEVNQSLTAIARVQIVRSRLITTTSQLMEGDAVVADASGKYVPISVEQHNSFVATLVDEPQSREARAVLVQSGTPDAAPAIHL